MGYCSVANLTVTALPGSKSAPDAIQKVNMQSVIVEQLVRLAGQPFLQPDIS